MNRYSKQITLGVLLVVIGVLTSCYEVLTSHPRWVYLVSADETKSWPKPYMQGATDQFFMGTVPARTGIKIYTVKYRTFLNHKMVVASGTIALPENPGSYPLVVNLHGTETDNDKVPSGVLEDPMETMSMIYNLPSSQGWITAMPDYIGFGESDEYLHPYMVKQPTVQAIDDFLKACVQFVDSLENYQLDKRLAIMGYSQGGWAALAYHNAFDSLQALHDAPEWSLQFNSVGSAPTDLNAMQSDILARDTFEASYYLAYVASAYEEYQLKKPLVKHMVQKEYRDTIPEIFDPNIQTNLYYFPSDLSVWLTSEYIQESTDPDGKFSHLVGALENNAITPFFSKVPVKFFQTPTDEVVPFYTAEAFVDGMVENGTPDALIDLVTIPGDTHAGAAPYYIGATLQMLMAFNP